MTLGTFKEHYTSIRLFLCQPGRRQNPSESHHQSSSFRILLFLAMHRGSQCTVVVSAKGLGYHAIVQHLCSSRDRSLLSEQIGFHCWADDTRTCLRVNPVRPVGLQGWADKLAGRCDPPCLDATAGFPRRETQIQLGLIHTNISPMPLPSAFLEQCVRFPKRLDSWILWMSNDFPLLLLLFFPCTLPHTTLFPSTKPNQKILRHTELGDKKVPIH